MDVERVIGHLKIIRTLAAFYGEKKIEIDARIYPDIVRWTDEAMEALIYMQKGEGKTSEARKRANKKYWEAHREELNRKQREKSRKKRREEKENEADNKGAVSVCDTGAGEAVYAEPEIRARGEGLSAEPEPERREEIQQRDGSVRGGGEDSGGGGADAGYSDDGYAENAGRESDWNMAKQLCWDCYRATKGLCSWSRAGIPVKGWKATKSEKSSVSGYAVEECPKFVRDCAGYGMYRMTAEERRAWKDEKEARGLREGDCEKWLKEWRREHRGTA